MVYICKFKITESVTLLRFVAKLEFLEVEEEEEVVGEVCVGQTMTIFKNFFEVLSDNFEGAEMILEFYRIRSD